MIRVKTGRFLCLLCIYSVLTANIHAESQAYHADTGSVEYAIDVLNRRVPVGYDYDSVHEYYVYANSGRFVAHLKGIINDSRKVEHWDNAIHALGIIGSVDKTDIPLSVFTDYAAKWEALGNKSDKVVPMLNRLYTSIAQYGTESALDFLKERASVDYWDNDMPSKINEYSHSDYTSTHTAQSEAVFALSHFQPDSLLGKQMLNAMLEEQIGLGNQSLVSRIEGALRHIEDAKNSYSLRNKAYVNIGGVILNEPVAVVEELPTLIEDAKPLEVVESAVEEEPEPVTEPKPEPVTPTKAPSSPVEVAGESTETTEESDNNLIYIFLGTIAAIWAGRIVFYMMRK